MRVGFYLLDGGGELLEVLLCVLLGELVALDQRVVRLKRDVDRSDQAHKHVCAHQPCQPSRHLFAICCVEMDVHMDVETPTAMMSWKEDWTESTNSSWVRWHFSPASPPLQ